MRSISLIVLAAALLSTVCAQSTSANEYGELVGKGYELFGAGKFEEACGSFEKALAISPLDGQVWFQYGRSASAAKRWDDVLRAGEKVLEYGAFDGTVTATIHFEMACAYAQKGNKEQAWTCLNKAMDAGLRSLPQVRDEPRLASLHDHKGWEELAATRDVTKMSRDEGWRYDLWLLDRELRRIHYAPYKYKSEDDRKRIVSDLNARIPKLTDSQITVEFYRYVAGFGDGHTVARMAKLKRPSLQLFWFEEGVFVALAGPEYRNLAGAQLLEVCGKPITEVMTMCEPLISRDNAMGLRNAEPTFAINPVILEGLGLKKEGVPIPAKFHLRDGKEEVVQLESTESTPSTAGWEKGTSAEPPLYLKNREKTFWFEPLPEQKAVYAQYNAIRNDPTETVAQFAEKLFKYIDDNAVEHLILDVRWNRGGNTFLSQPLVLGLIARPKINRNGGLYVITGRNTFSAAQNFTTDISRSCTAIFVGEPTGSRPNFVGESIPFQLPYSEMTGTVSDLYWQRSWPMDDRMWIAPDLPTPPTFASYRDGVDPAMEAILNELKKPSQR
jgi:hypothetical protein